MRSFLPLILLGLFGLGIAPAAGSQLLDGLKGFAEKATGGLGGQVYVVTSTEDSPRHPRPGTLRYGIERTAGPTWIVFDPEVFPMGQTTVIEVYRPLKIWFREQLTIDGRGSQVEIRKKYFWEDAYWVANDNGVWECYSIDSPRRDMGPILKIRSSRNIVVSHLMFHQLIEGRKPVGGERDTECFSDGISIYNTFEQQRDLDFTFTDIWINQCSFFACGDECIGISRASLKERSFVSLSANSFAESNKGVLVGGEDEEPYMLAVSLYENHFDNVVQRSPRVEGAVAHLFNNVIENWVAYGVGVWDFTRVTLEENIFRAGENDQGPWRDFSEVSGYVWTRGNIFAGVDSPEDYQSRGFHDPRQPVWYYQEGLSWPLEQWGYLASLERIRADAGWMAEENDVREKGP